MVQRKKTTEPPPVIVNEFTVQEIDIGIEKLKRRIADVQRLNPNKISAYDGEVGSIEQRIRETIREIFESNSPQFRDYEHLTIYFVVEAEERDIHQRGASGNGREGKCGYGEEGRGSQVRRNLCD